MANHYKQMAYCSEVCGSEHIKSVSGSSCHGFGVRSYLHHFYEECAASVWEQEAPGRSSAQRWSAALCRVPLVLGALVLSAGLVVLAAGLAVPSRIEAFGEEELLFVDRRAVRHNQGLHVCVQAGAGMLCLGGLLAAAGLLASAFSRPVAGPDERVARRLENTGAELYSQCLRLPAQQQLMEQVQLLCPK